MKLIIQLVSIFFAINLHAEITTAPQVSIFTKNQRIDNYGVEIYSNNLEMKTFKKIGIGVAMGGLNGGFGINGEFNLEPANALFLGVGRGEAYNSFNFGWKYNFESLYLSPYTKVGYAKWFNNNAGGGSASSNDILKRVLSEKEIRENKFGTNFVAGGAGLEYNQIEGDLSGVNFYGELLVMTDLSKVSFIPTGAVGLIYFY